MGLSLHFDFDIRNDNCTLPIQKPKKDPEQNNPQQQIYFNPSLPNILFS